MHRHSMIAAMLLGLVAGEPAMACRINVPITLEDVRYADVVLVGRVSNYRIVRDEDFRRRMLDRSDLPADMRRLYDGRNSLMSDYARFDIQVGEVLSGRAPDRLSVTWDNSTFSEPGAMPAGPYLIALRRPGSRIPPLRGPSGTIVPNADRHSLTLLQAPCSRAFMFDSRSDEARVVRRILEARRP